MTQSFHPPGSAGVERKAMFAFGWIPLPKRVAERYFVPDYRLIGRDVTLERVRAIRSWLGLGVLVWIAVTYGGGEDAAQGWMASFVASVFVAIIACPIAVAIIVGLTRSDVRAQTRKSLMLPLRSLGLFVVVSVATLGGLTALAYGSQQINAGADVGSFFLTVLGLAVSVWVLRFWFLAVRAIPQHLFRAVDGHPLLPAVIAPWLSWCGALVDLGDGGGKGALPTGVRLIGTLGGPVTITVMSLWEIRRVRSRYGVTFRGGPHPTRRPEPVPPPMPLFPNQAAPWQPQPPQGFFPPGLPGAPAPPYRAPDPQQHPAWQRPPSGHHRPPPPWGPPRG
ncbi:hypothetical protein [Embleya sp. NPDC005971]|uniref:hypothetical protein n=1 Tax=unclassified Embleya TaxID=2699296 RepID=UPI00340E4AD3